MRAAVYHQSAAPTWLNYAPPWDAEAHWAAKNSNSNSETRDCCAAAGEAHDAAQQHGLTVDAQVLRTSTQLRCTPGEKLRMHFCLWSERAWCCHGAPHHDFSPYPHQP